MQPQIHGFFSELIANQVFFFRANPAKPKSPEPKSHIAAGTGTVDVSTYIEWLGAIKSSVRVPSARRR